MCGQIGDYLLMTRQTIALNPERPCWLDAQALHTSLLATRDPATDHGTLERAVALSVGTLAAGSGAETLIKAVKQQNPAVINQLMRQGADVNARAPYGNTALTEAAFYGHLPVIKELLMRGADANAVGGGGTALDIALNQKNPAVVDLLQHYGAKRAADLR